MLEAGRLRHRVTLQKPVFTQDSVTGDMVPSWEDVETIWAEISPLSVREFIAANAEQSKIIARIVIRYRDDLDNTMRFLHSSSGKVYNIEGALADPDSGMEYLTVPVSQGLRYTEYTRFFVVHNGVQVTHNGVPVVYTPQEM